MAHQNRPFPLTLETMRSSAPWQREVPEREGPATVPAPDARRNAFVFLPATPGSEQSLIARTLAHELRATLALISGYSQTVQHLPLDNDVRIRYLERISTASAQLSDLTDQILSVALSPRRAEEPLLEPVSLRQLYLKTVAQISAALDAIEVHVNVPADVPLVEADATWVALVIRNLVSNAAKYGDGTPVSITAWRSGAWVVTRVSDSGSGIGADERGRVFEPFFRGRRARESGTTGSGLGLDLCNQLVAAHGGRMWIDDSTSGLAICFSLKRARVHGALAAPRRRAASGEIREFGTEKPS